MFKKIRNWKIWLTQETLGLSAEQAVALALQKNSSGDIKSSKHANIFLYEHDFQGKNISLYVKHFLDRNFTDGIKHIFRTSRAQRAANGNQLLKENGFDIAENIAWGFQQKLLLKNNSFLITKEISNAKPLHEFVNELSEDAELRKSFIKQLAGTVGRMHRLRIFHGDMRPGNILIKEGSGRFDFYFIDNERTKKTFYLPEKLRIKNLVQLNMLISDKIQPEERQYFFGEYVKVSNVKNVQSLMEKVANRTHQRLQRLAELGRINENDIWM